MAAQLPPPQEATASLNAVGLKQAWSDHRFTLANSNGQRPQANDLEGPEAEIQAGFPSAIEVGGRSHHSNHEMPPGTKLDSHRSVLKTMQRIRS